MIAARCEKSTNVMTTVGENASFNASFIDIIWQYIYELSNLFLSIIGLTSNIAVEGTPPTNFAFELYNSVINWLAFDEFQIKLLKGFTFILCANLFLIFISWRVYGKRIAEKFMKPATSKAIEELKKSVSLLKLPKEHSPRV